MFCFTYIVRNEALRRLLPDVPLLRVCVCCLSVLRARTGEANTQHALILVSRCVGSLECYRRNGTGGGVPFSERMRRCRDKWCPSETQQGGVIKASDGGVLLRRVALLADRVEACRFEKCRRGIAHVAWGYPRRDPRTKSGNSELVKTYEGTHFRVLKVSVNLSLNC